jgi:Flp pilus assembly protein TadG
MRTVREHFVRGQPFCHCRKGTILVITAIVMLALVGLLGLVIDGGQLMTAHRKTQNAADAAATAAAMDIQSGSSNAVATATATTFVQQYNGLPTATVTVNFGPVSGPHAGDSNYVEVIVSHSVAVRFIQVMGVATSQTVRARAVAGREGTSTGAGVMMLDPDARPGFDASGSAIMRVNGTVVINSNGGGLTETGQPINNGNSGSALLLTGNAKLYARDVQSVGGLIKTGSASVENYVSSNPANPLHTGRPITADPFLNLPVPTTANGASATVYPAVNLNGVHTATLSPGVYPSIKVTASAKATLNPGVYIIRGGGLSVSGDATISGTGVLIYNTGSDYNVNTGLPDSGDLSQSPPASGGATFGAVKLFEGGKIDFTGINNSASPFNGMVYYQRRLNTSEIDFSGYSPLTPFKGTVYAKWANLKITGSRDLKAQFVVRSVRIDGGTSITVDTAGQSLAKVYQVFLVE